MSDNYEFSKSTLPQGISMESPYANKNYQYLNDINGGIYSNAGLTLVQFDLSSIYNSQSFIDPSQMFCVIPITYVSAYSSSVSANSASNSNLLAPVSGGWASLGLKNGYYQMLHGADLVVNGKTIEQYQPNLNSYVNFRLLSQMSQDDLKTLGASLGMGEALDNPQSLAFYQGTNIKANNTITTIGSFPTAPVAPASTTTSWVGGNGVSNNFPFSSTPNFGDQPGIGVSQFTNAYNQGYYSRLKKCVDTTTTATNIFGSSALTGTSAVNIMNLTQLNAEFKATYQVLNTNYAVWYDYAVIRMCDIFDSMKSLCLLKKFDGILRMYFNTGSIGTTAFNGITNLTGTNALITSSSVSTFTNTCPLLQSANISATASASLYPTTTQAIASGLFIGKATSTSLFGGINLANSGASNPMGSCRMYYPQITLKPEKLIPYISENRSKKIVYTSILTNQFSNISAGASFSALVQSGVQNIRGVLILPFISSTINGSAGSAIYSANSVVPFAQALSPFDTAPATSAPLSLQNLQVAVGGQNILQNTLNFTYENFLEQVSLYEKINAGDLGLSCGLINQNYWENAYRAYYCDATRGNISDLLAPRNVNISFTNNSNLNIDVLVFTEYFSDFVVDVETGLITK